MRKYCANCELIQDAVIRIEVQEFKVKKNKVTAKIVILTCSQCGDEVYDKDNEVSNDIMIFDQYKKTKKLMTSKEIIRIREKYSISQVTLSKIMGFGIKTITRYENGAIQDNAHDNLLRLASLDANFYRLWIMSKESLTEAENIKIALKLCATTDITK